MQKLLFVLLVVFFCSFSYCSTNKEIKILKKMIIDTSNKYQGKGDPNLKIQNDLKQMVDKLISITSNPPLDMRKKLYTGTWQQIWGAYDYSNNKRGVDSQIDSSNLYQIIFENGYYYNVTRLLDKKSKDEKYITLLKGVYEVLPGNLVRFNLRKLTKVKGFYDKDSYLNLPTLSEDKKLKGESKILPNWIVSTFLNGGFLIEVYLDSDLRIFYFYDDDDFKVPYLFIMKRVYS